MDIEKTMEFILSAQARLEASAVEHGDRLAKLETSVATVTDLVGRIAQAEIRLAERMEAGFQKLQDLHADTEYKLNSLIEIVDKLVRHDGNKN